jgi:CRP/FNR family transcriptional regulator, cyclic AMP receptor protein
MTSSFAELQPDVEPLGTVSDFVNEFIDAVEPRHWFDGFSRQETALFSEYLQCFGVPRESVVLREGDEGDFLAILVTGRAVILKTYQGVQKTVHEVMPGELIGEMSLVDGQRRYATCITTEPSDFAVLTQDNFNALLADHPRLGNKFMLTLLKHNTARLREATSVMLPGLLESTV